MMNSHWLTPEEKENVCRNLIRYRLVKWDNNRGLPLKSGGKTDIYINLREARSTPGAISYIARQFANPLFRLDPARFAEIPDSVSCFAGPLSELLQIPYVTIREQAKAGRVAKATMIGEARYDEFIPMIDDVVTDGASKIEPYKELRRQGIRTGLVVLVDRQQGWKKKFRELGIALDVWAGMTLHDVRRFLIEEGLMERCDKDLEAKNPFIVALDGKSWEEVLSIVDPLRTTGCILKVNDLMFGKGMESLVPDLSVYGRVMADLKGHDIPNTLANISKWLLPNPPWAITVHASGGANMIEAVVKAFEGTPTKVLAVTVLTSLDEKDCKEIYVRRPWDEVKALAAIAARAGAHGFVCSPAEVKKLKKLYPYKKLVTPGVRSAGQDPQDQKRVDTPENTKANGADYLVMGREILGAPDPVAKVKELLARLKIA